MAGSKAYEPAFSVGSFADYLVLLFHLNCSFCLERDERLVVHGQMRKGAKGVVVAYFSSLFPISIDVGNHKKHKHCSRCSERESKPNYGILSRVGEMEIRFSKEA